MDIGQVRYELQVLPKELICEAGKSLESVIYRFTSSHTPLFGFDEKNKFVGLVTIKKSLFNRRNGPTTLIQSCLIQPPNITKETSITEILRMMSELSLYTLPMFDKRGRIRGVISVKSVLGQLIKNKIYLENLINELPSKKVITIVDKETVGRALVEFRDKNISRLVVIDNKNKVKGVITKRDIVSAYFAPTNRQRFSSRGGLKNYSFDSEKVYRDEQSLKKYMSTIIETVDKDTKPERIVKRLIDSKFNAIVLVDKDKKPYQILSIRDVLEKSLEIIAGDEMCLNIVANFPDNIGWFKKNRAKKILNKLNLWISKKEKVQLIKLMTKVAYTVKNKPDRFEVKLMVETDKNEYVANCQDRNFLVAMAKVTEQIKKQINYTRPKGRGILFRLRNSLHLRHKCRSFFVS